LRQVEEEAQARGYRTMRFALARARHESRSQQFPKSVEEAGTPRARARVRMD